MYSAGMPRSGSTLLFNILKLILENKYGEKLSFGWVDDVKTIRKGDIYLIKTHGLTKMDIYRASDTFYTFRDIRDVLVSRYRMFNKEPEMGIVKYYIDQDIFAKKHASMVFKYDTLVNEQRDSIIQIASRLNVQVNPDNILTQLPDPANKNGNEDYHSPDTLLHKNHVTGTKRGEWQHILPQKLINQIHSEFGWWFKENGYDL